MTETARQALLAALQERIGYRFADPELLERALTHASWAHERGGTDNQRLEFLGDAVLNSIIGQHLFHAHPAANEGELSHFKHRLVRGETLAAIGRDLGLPALLRVGTGAQRSAVHQRSAKIEDATEALVGALFLDGGFEVAARVALAWFDRQLAALRDLRTTSDEAKDIVTRLHEAAQSTQVRCPVRLVEIGRIGPSHEPCYFVGWWCGGELLATDWGTSIKRARRNTAARALERLNELIDQRWIPDRAAEPPSAESLRRALPLDHPLHPDAPSQETP